MSTVSPGAAGLGGLVDFNPLQSLADVKLTEIDQTETDQCASDWMNTVSTTAVSPSGEDTSDVDKDLMEMQPTIKRLEEGAWALMEAQRVCQKEAQQHWQLLEECRGSLEAELLNLLALVNLPSARKHYHKQPAEFERPKGSGVDKESTFCSRDGSFSDAAQANNLQYCMALAVPCVPSMKSERSECEKVTNSHEASWAPPPLSPLGHHRGKREVRPSQLERSKTTLLKLMEAAEAEEEKSLATQQAEMQQRQPAWKRMVKSTKFDLFVGILIVANTLVMSLQLEYDGWVIDPRCVPPCDATWELAEIGFIVLEQCFTALFACELFLRLLVDGFGYLKSVGNLLDAIIVLVSAADSWLLTPLGSEGMSNVAILRLVRLVRLSKVLRVVRVMKAFKSLRVLVSAVAASVGALAWSMTLLFVLELSGAIFLAQVLRPFIEDPVNSDQTREFLWLRFGTWYRAMLTIFEITMAPGGFIQYRRLCEEAHPVFGLILAVYVCIVTFAVVRVITALFLKATLSASNQDEARIEQAKASQRENYSKQLLNAVKTSSGDEDNDVGHIERGELRKLMELPRMKEWLKDVELPDSEAERLFEALDPGDGLIPFPEFINCLIRMRGPPRSSDAVVALYESRRIIDWLDRIDGLLSHHFGFKSQASTGLEKLVKRVKPTEIKTTTVKKERLIHL